MNNDERYKYLWMMPKRFEGAGREELGQLLSEMERITGLHRKSFTQMMNGWKVDNCEIVRIVRDREAI